MIIDEKTEYVHFTDEQFLAALDGRTVEVNRPRYNYTLTFNGKEFVMEFKLGVLTANEIEMAKVRLF